MKKYLKQLTELN